MGTSTNGQRAVGFSCLALGLAVVMMQGCSASSADLASGGPLGSDGVTASSDGSGSLATDPSGEVGAGSTSSGGAEGTGGSEQGGAAGSSANPERPARVAPPRALLVPDGQLTAGIFDDNLSFAFFTRYSERVRATVPIIPVAWSEYVAAHTAWQEQRPVPTQLDISLVIDTTGSMGDELAYLKEEFSSLASEIQSAYPEARQHWSLVVYRDEGDEYVTRAFDFTEDRAAFQQFLEAQSYDGGGDFPEAPDAAMATANALSWRLDEQTARLLFLVADAPHHDQKAQAMASAILDARSRDIHIYPVASSGIDELTEHTFRSAAQLTRGRYIFLTDDSGLGGAHKEPTLPCYYVTTLEKAILRSVEVELTGETAAPAPSETVRFAGDLNEEGNCFFGDGFEARPF